MPNISFNTSNSTYRQLMGNGLLYRIPRFQRDYSWTDTEWDDLWQDIQNTITASYESSHYMGYLVLQSSNNKNFEVIDGQQRLTTISILILAVLWHLQKLVEGDVEPIQNKQRYDQLRNSFIGYLDPVTLLSKSKLTLNRNNDFFYQNYLVAMQRPPQRGLKSTEHLMRKAFEWFKDRINDVYGNQNNGAVLAQFIDDLVNNLFFTVITVNDELNAFKVFEILNARGVRLSSTDLLKNYLFSAVSLEGNDERELNELDNRWEKITSTLGNESFPDFLRTHWNSRNKFLRHAELYKAIREKIVTRRDVFQLLRDMESDADVYVALSSPEDILWNSDQKKYIEELKMFSVRQVYPLLLAAHRSFSSQDFTLLSKACSIISFRYNIIGNMAANDQERVYHNLAARISQGEIKTFNDAVRELRSVYPNDEQFKAMFSEKQLKTSQTRNKRIAKYILFSIEKHLVGSDFDSDSEIYSLEHILPENPGEGWEHFSINEHEQFVFRLGNFTIIRADKNKMLGNSNFEVKKLVFKESDFEITRRIALENLEWTTDRIAKRQKWMAEQAKSIWKINQLA